MKKLRFLLIDDNEIDNYISEHIIKKQEVSEHIQKVDSARAGLDYLNSSKNDKSVLPDVIFLDIKMPEIDGFGFLERFESLDELIKRTSKIVMLSSSNNPDDIERATRSPHVIKYLEKPLGAESLLGVLNVI